MRQILTIITLGFVGSIFAALIVKFVREERDMRRDAASFAEAEKRFRDAERQLDELLRREEAVIAASGITISDESTRAYYKEPYLSWSYGSR